MDNQGSSDQVEHKIGSRRIETNGHIEEEKPQVILEFMQSLDRKFIES